MKGQYWPLMTEEERYEMWSKHLEVGAKFIHYPEFCDRLDKMNQLSSIY